MPGASTHDAWPRRVLVGVDGSERSVDALAFGRLLAERAGASLSAGCVYGPSHTFGPLATEGEANAAVGHASTRTPGLDEHRTRLVQASSPAEGLRRLVGEEAADIMVVGSSHRSGVGRVLPGTAAGQLLQGAPCAVAVAPNGFALRQDAGLRVTGVGFDGSEESRAALAAAELLALTVGGAIRVFCVLPDGPASSPQARGLAASIREQMLLELHEAAQALVPEVRALPVTLRGDPGRELLERSEEVELMVLGSRGHGRLRRLMLGSVAEALLSGAECPVVVVPPVSGGQPADDDPTNRTSRTATPAAR